MDPAYDALLIVGFGGPEQREDVIPFLENVLRGRNVPRERMLAVAEHYYHFDGVSPINAQTRELIAALRTELDRRGVALPIHWGNRNWHPMLTDTLRDMATQRVRRALALVLAAYGSYSSCRQYLENIADARAAVPDGAPDVDKIRLFYNHPGFIQANAEHLAEAVRQFSPDVRHGVHVAFTAHSIPMSMANSSNYAEQLRETCRLVAEAAHIPPARWQLAYQSRSGRPTDPWLEPDILEHLQALKAGDVENVVILPIGFLSDHLEVLFDLDVEAKQQAKALGIHVVRAKTVGTHPLFVTALVDLIEERIAGKPERPCLGNFGAAPDACAADCCPRPTMGRPSP